VRLFKLISVVHRVYPYILEFWLLSYNKPRSRAVLRCLV
jgi:hypothetical protein